MPALPVSFDSLIDSSVFFSDTLDSEDSDSELLSSLTKAAASWIFLRPKGIFYIIIVTFCVNSFCSSVYPSVAALLYLKYDFVFCIESSNEAIFPNAGVFTD